MSNLYTRLVTDENHQTEALVDLLERICETGVEQFRDFVAQVLLGNPTNEEKKNYFLEQLRKSRDPISMETQFRTPQQDVPDFVVLEGGAPNLYSGGQGQCPSLGATAKKIRRVSS